MIAIGCIAPIIFAVIGILLGNWLGGAAGAVWGGATGLFGGGIVLGLTGWLMRQIKE